MRPSMSGGQAFLRVNVNQVQSHFTSKLAMHITRVPSTDRSLDASITPFGMWADLHIVSGVRTGGSLTRKAALLLIITLLLSWSRVVSAQIVVLSTFDPSEAGSLCGLALDPDTASLWIYDCSDDEILHYGTDGTFRGAVPRPGESANDVDLEIAPEALMLGTTSVPEGTLLFINGETDEAEIYAVDKTNGAVLATLETDFGVSHVVGGAYHPTRNTFFLVQDKVPGAADENMIAEIDPASGEVLNTFQITDTFVVNFGDLDVSSSSGNLFIVSSDEDDIAEFTPEGDFVQRHALPDGVGSLSGLALNCATGEAWVSNTSGVISRLDQVACGVRTNREEVLPQPQTLRFATVYPNPFRTNAAFVVEVERSQHARIALHDILGREVETIYEGVLSQGEQVFSLDGTGLASGYYLLKIAGEQSSATHLLVRLR